MCCIVRIVYKFYKVSSVNYRDGTEANNEIINAYQFVNIMNTIESISVFSMSDFYCLQICLQIVINFI